MKNNSLRIAVILNIHNLGIGRAWDMAFDERNEAGVYLLEFLLALFQGSLPDRTEARAVYSKAISSFLEHLQALHLLSARFIAESEKRDTKILIDLLQLFILITHFLKSLSFKLHAIREHVLVFLNFLFLLIVDLSDLRGEVNSDNSSYDQAHTKAINKHIHIPMIPYSIQLFHPEKNYVTLLSPIERLI